MILAPFAYVVLVGGAVGMLAWVSDYKPDTPCPAERTAKPVTENAMSEDAALYAGPGPHPIVLVEPGIDRVWIRDPTDMSVPRLVVGRRTGPAFNWWPATTSTTSATRPR